MFSHSDFIFLLLNCLVLPSNFSLKTFSWPFTSHFDILSVFFASDLQCFLYSSRECDLSSFDINYQMNSTLEIHTVTEADCHCSEQIIREYASRRYLKWMQQFSSSYNHCSEKNKFASKLLWEIALLIVSLITWIAHVPLKDKHNQ